jgi:hypothetical protein
VSASDVSIALYAFGIVVVGMLIVRVFPLVPDAIRRSTPLTGVIYGGIVAAVVLFAPTATRPFIYFRF